MKYYGYSGDNISDNEYKDQYYRVIYLWKSDFKLEEDKEVLKYVFCNRMNREEINLSEENYKGAKKYMTGLSPQS